MPAPNRTPSKSTRAAAALKQLAGGNSVSGAARALGISRRTVQRDLANPSAKAIVTNLLERHAGDIEQLFSQSLAVARDAMGATIRVKVAADPPPAQVAEAGAEPLPEGVQEIPDHEIRLKAVDRLHSSAELLFKYSPHSTEEGATFQWHDFAQHVEQYLLPRLATSPSTAARPPPKPKPKPKRATRPPSRKKKGTASSSTTKTSSSRKQRT